MERRCCRCIPVQDEGASGSAVKTVSTSLGKRIKRPFADPKYGPKFRVFVISAALVHFGINLAVPAYSIMYVRDLGLSNAAIGSLSLAGGLTAVLAYPMWGRSVEKGRRGCGLCFVPDRICGLPGGLRPARVSGLFAHIEGRHGIFDAGLRLHCSTLHWSM